MTHPDHGTLVIVLGAGGRVGQALLARMAAAPWDVVAVSRKRPPSAAASARWMRVDVTHANRWEHSLGDFRDMAEDYAQVIIVDLVLDKASVATMRLSVASVTAYTVRLRTRLDAVNRPSSLVLASTTAVLAPWPYQTPYGLAKRRQLRRYAAEGMTGQVLLIPQLVSGAAPAGAAPAALTWTYSDAATRLQHAVAVASTTTSAGLRLITPASTRFVDSDGVHVSLTARIRALARVLTLHVLIATSRRNSPLAHRLASRARLELTPGRLRRRVDHHLVPERRVRLLCQRADITR